MKKLLPLFLLTFIGCSNWQYVPVVGAAAGLTKLVDIGVTTSDDWKDVYRVDGCLLSPYILAVHSGPFDWHGYAYGLMNGQFVWGEPIQCCWPWAST